MSLHLASNALYLQVLPVCMQQVIDRKLYDTDQAGRIARCAPLTDRAIPTT
jgi:hypothetical protein